MNDFSALVNRIAKSFPSHRALAKALDVSPSRLSRAMTGSGGAFAFNVANCLRLAKVSGESASAILRAAGKDDVADLIEALYGSPADTLSTDEREIVEMWRTITPRARQGFRVLMHDLAPKQERAEKKRRSA